MIKGFPIDPTAVYDGSSLSASLGIGAKALSRARQAGDLRFTRKGRRILYLGQWILDWLEHDAVSVKEGHNAQ
jgi:hypothetical protein